MEDACSTVQIFYYKNLLKEAANHDATRVTSWLAASVKPSFIGIIKKIAEVLLSDPTVGSNLIQRLDLRALRVGANSHALPLSTNVWMSQFLRRWPMLL